ncbi:hypothetical protein Pcinc_005471 [Petrolisthes cinctipes]|uniref:Craniofacial development protein 2 n=1 Tax=Petrolisthes cinctipes TaxID=88211 RepID=A0AAE1GET4_PETCI|nr:hypothetical protein Pcinc_005471 [Petrolisthes cinctipes]
MESVIEVIRWDDRMMKIKLVVGEKVLNIFSVYAPQQGRPDEEKEEFREKLSDRISEVSRGDIVIVAGDMNVHIGRDNGGYEEVMGGYGIGQKNKEGEQMLQLCQLHNLRIWKTWFMKREEHLITFKSGDTATQIDYIMSRGEGVWVQNCKVIPGEECITQHWLLCADLVLKMMMKLKKKRGERYGDSKTLTYREKSRRN